jgi:hypothetical protein
MSDEHADRYIAKLTDLCKKHCVCGSLADAMESLGIVDLFVIWITVIRGSVAVRCSQAYLSYNNITTGFL